jgi:hypothetical protein
MAVLNDGRSITLTAAGDSISGRKCLGSLVIQGNAANPGDEFVIGEFDGNVIARGYITAAAEYLHVLPSSPYWVDGLAAVTLPAGCRVFATII